MKLLLLFLLPSFLFSQSDTIFKNNGKIIPCTITYVNESTVFFKDKKDYGDQANLKDINWYSQSGNRTNTKIILDTTGNALYVNDVDINSLDMKYCELAGFDVGLFKSSMIVYVDYGQFIGYGQNMTIRDKKGKMVKFNSMVDALNFMDKNGWEYVNQSASSGPSSLFGKPGIMYKYLLKKKKP